MANYFRVTGYCEKENFCFIMDSYGLFNKKWQFSAFLIQKGLRIIEVSDDTQFFDGNISKIKHVTDKYVLCAYAKGKPEYINKIIDDVIYKAVKVGNKFYIPTNNN